GLDVNTAVYEWDYPRQMLEIRLLEARGEAKSAATRDIFSEAFLIRRPLLRALGNSRREPPVLLIDEIDRADEEFEAYLLEVLADFAITIPEIGTIKAERPPRVIITSNRTREVHDALKRRCLYHWIDYPTAERELAILTRRMPELSETLAREVVGFVQRLRSADLTKVPGIAETIDWAAALAALGAERLEAEQIERTLGALLKYQEDVSAMRGGGAARGCQGGGAGGLRSAPRGAGDLRRGVRPLLAPQHRSGRRIRGAAAHPPAAGSAGGHRLRGGATGWCGRDRRGRADRPNGREPRGAPAHGRLRRSHARRSARCGGDAGGALPQAPAAALSAAPGEPKRRAARR